MDSHGITLKASLKDSNSSSGSSGQYLKSQGVNQPPVWSNLISGTDNRLVRCDSTDKIQSSGITIDDSDNVSIPGAVTTSSTALTSQMRNSVISTSSPSGGANGDVWYKYT